MIYLGLFATTCILLLLLGCTEKDWTYQFPFLAACVFLGWIFPQIITLFLSQELPSFVLNNFVFMNVISIVGIGLGDWIARVHSEIHTMPGLKIYDPKKLSIAALLFLCIGAAAIFVGIWYLKSDLMKNESHIGSLAAILLLMLAINVKYGLGIAWLGILKALNRISLSIVIVGTVIYLVAIVALGRRAMALDLALIVLLSFWFVRRQAIPKWIMIVLVLLSAGWVSSAKGFRSLFTGRSSEFSTGLLRSGDGECRNGALVMWDAQRKGSYDYGWKGVPRLLYGHFPGQPLGGKLRETLFPSVGYAPRNVGEFDLQQNLSITGTADSFKSFSYFGALLFVGLGYFMQRCYRRATGGSLGCQFTYIFTLCAALHVITHGFYTMLVAMVHMVVFFFPIFLLTRTKEPQSVPRAG